jgi:hypothetical protein
VPTRTIPQPTSVLAVIASPRNNLPHTTAKSGTRKVTVNARVGPMSTMSR